MASLPPGVKAMTFLTAVVSFLPPELEARINPSALQLFCQGCFIAAVRNEQRHHIVVSCLPWLLRTKLGSLQD